MPSRAENALCDSTACVTSAGRYLADETRLELSLILVRYSSAILAAELHGDRYSFDVIVQKDTVFVQAASEHNLLSRTGIHA